MHNPYVLDDPSSARTLRTARHYQRRPEACGNKPHPSAAVIDVSTELKDVTCRSASKSGDTKTPESRRSLELPKRGCLAGGA
jgi:hypothetical protein